MKAWIKAIIIALLALFTASCTIEFNDDDCEDDAYYLFEGRTWSRIVEERGYYYFVCYDFYRDGTFTYWYYEDDSRSPALFSIESGHWDVHSHGCIDEITISRSGIKDVYDVDDFLRGLSDCNSNREINDYKRLIDDLYYHH